MQETKPQAAPSLVNPIKKPSLSAKALAGTLSTRDPTPEIFLSSQLVLSGAIKNSRGPTGAS